jgi:hypothetical protein
MGGRGFFVIHSSRQIIPFEGGALSLVFFYNPDVILLPGYRYCTAQKPCVRVKSTTPSQLFPPSPTGNLLQAAAEIQIGCWRRNLSARDLKGEEREGSQKGREEGRREGAGGSLLHRRIRMSPRSV